MTCPHCGGKFPADQPKGLYDTMKCRECWHKDARAFCASTDKTPWARKMARKLLVLDVIMEWTIMCQPVYAPYKGPVWAC